MVDVASNLIHREREVYKKWSSIEYKNIYDDNEHS